MKKIFLISILSLVSTSVFSAARCLLYENEQGKAVSMFIKGTSRDFAQCIKSHSCKCLHSEKYYNAPELRDLLAPLFEKVNQSTLLVSKSLDQKFNTFTNEVTDLKLQIQLLSEKNKRLQQQLDSNHIK